MFFFFVVFFIPGYFILDSPVPPASSVVSFYLNVVWHPGIFFDSSPIFFLLL